MKKLLAFILAALTLLSLCACGESAATPTEPTISTVATETDIATLEGLYKDHTPYFGDMHNHSMSGPRSDGKVPLVSWEELVMKPKQMDFAVIVDHKQTSHMRLPEWNDAL